MLLDLIATRSQLRAHVNTASGEMERCLATAQSPANEHTFLRTMPESARQTAAQAGIEQSPLAGLAVSVKDLFDIAGQTTAAGSTALATAPPAHADSAAVARLRAAGGAIIGRTNTVEFAFSGVGINPHFGTPSAYDGRSGPLPGAPRVPGGSSSGAAVSVATGAAFVGLGSDTGGSIRIPAALNGIVGFKSTARLVPTAGTIPLSTTLDTVSAMTRSVRDAVLVHEILAARQVTRSSAPLSAYRLAVPRTLMLDQMDDVVAHAFERTLATLRGAGAQIDTIDIPALSAQPAAGFSPPEAYAWHRDLLAHHGQLYDPRVRARIEGGAALTAWEYLQLVEARKGWIARVEVSMQGYDAMLSPTVPIVAPLISTIAPGAPRDAEFFRVNALLLRNTSAVNLLDGCALSLPCHISGELPVGLMVWQGALRDDTVLNVGEQIEKVLQK